MTAPHHEGQSLGAHEETDCCRLELPAETNENAY